MLAILLRFVAVVAFVGMFGALLVKSQAQQETVRDTRGRTLGIITKSGNVTTFRDDRGRTVGTTTIDAAGTKIFRDNRGSTLGTLQGGKR